MDSIYDKYGGQPFWDSLLNRFYDKNLSDPILTYYFEGKDIDKIKSMNRGLLAAALKISGDPFLVSIKRVHKGIDVANEHFNHFINNLKIVLEESNVASDDVEEIMMVVTSFEEDVVKHH